jgi:hypothetical protein
MGTKAAQAGKAFPLLALKCRRIHGLKPSLADNANLEQLAAACHQRQRYTFMLCLGPLRLRRVTGSPVNPIALF